MSNSLIPNIDQIRTYLYSNYPGKVWIEKLDKMSDEQLISLWFAVQGVLDTNPIPKALHKPNPLPYDFQESRYD